MERHALTLQRASARAQRVRKLRHTNAHARTRLARLSRRSRFFDSPFAAAQSRQSQTPARSANSLAIHALPTQALKAVVEDYLATTAEVGSSFARFSAVCVCDLFVARRVCCVVGRGVWGFRRVLLCLPSSSGGLGRARQTKEPVNQNENNRKSQVSLFIYFLHSNAIKSFDFETFVPLSLLWCY